MKNQTGKIPSHVGDCRRTLSHGPSVSKTAVHPDFHGNRKGVRLITNQPISQKSTSIKGEVENFDCEVTEGRRSQ